MFTLINFMFITLLIVNFMMMLANLLSKKSFSDREKNSPFECGFDPKNSARIPFSMHFFLIAIIFLIFDVEITLLLPLISTLKLTNPFTFFMLLTFFIFILLSGLFHEWKQGALNWST